MLEKCIPLSLFAFLELIPRFPGSSRNDVRIHSSDPPFHPQESYDDVSSQQTPSKYSEVKTTPENQKKYSKKKNGTFEKVEGTWKFGKIIIARKYTTSENFGGTEES